MTTTRFGGGWCPVRFPEGPVRAISSRACPTPRAFSPWPVHKQTNCVRTRHGDTTCRYCTPRVAGFIFRFQSFFHENTRVPPFHWWVPDFRSQPSAASLLRKFQSLPSPPPPLWHPAYADSSASRQTARWTHVNKGLQASMSSASTSSSYCLKNEVYKIKNCATEVFLKPAVLRVFRTWCGCR